MMAFTIAVVVVFTLLIGLFFFGASDIYHGRRP